MSTSTLIWHMYIWHIDVGRSLKVCSHISKFLAFMNAPVIRCVCISKYNDTFVYYWSMLTTLKKDGKPVKLQMEVQQDALWKVNRVKEIRRRGKDGLKINRQQHLVRKNVSQVDSVRWKGVQRLSWRTATSFCVGPWVWVLSRTMTELSYWRV